MPPRTQRLLSLFALLAYLAGVWSLSQYAPRAHNTYFSENALVAGGARISLARSDLRALPAGGLPAALAAFSALGLPCAASPNGTYAACVLKAARGDGKESIALAAPLYAPAPGRFSGADVLLSVAAYLAGQRWLAKDTVFFVGAPGAPLEAAFDDYFLRSPIAGQMQAALVLDFPPLAAGAALAADFHGLNGQLPNLDLLNVIRYLAERDGRSHFVHGTPFASQRLAALEDLLARALPRPQARFMLKQALGLPTGTHSFLTKYHVDAVTLSLLPGTPTRRYREITPEKVATVVAATTKSLNNLLERLHQSFYLYVLPVEGRYVSVAEYTLSLALVIAPLVIALLPFVKASTTSTGENMFATRNTVPFAVILAVHVALFALALSPAYRDLALLGFLLANVVLPVVLRFILSKPSAQACTALSLLPAAIFLGTFSLVNFSFDIFVAIIAVPLLWLPSAPASRKPIRFLQTVFAFAVSLVGLGVAFCALSGFGPQEVGAMLVDNFAQYGSLFFPFLALIYSPANTLQILALLGSSD